jgi:hypothetical protein
VVLLLNLAYVPDSVIRGLPDFKNGWQVHFKSGMLKFRSDFEERTGKTWKF